MLEKIKLLVAITTLALAPVAAWSGDSAVAAPRFTVDNIYGGQISLDSLKGKVVYVDFWASWCGPCVKSFPFMEELQQKYADDGFVIVAINMDQNPDDAHAFLDAHPVTFLIGLDAAGDVAKKFGVFVMPSSYIIDREGLIQEAHTGFKSRDVEKIRSLVENLL